LRDTAETAIARGCADGRKQSHARDSIVFHGRIVREICAAKPRNSAQRCENPKWLNHPASATVRKAVKMSAKTLS
jgi:hypothetical protein